MTHRTDAGNCGLGLWAWPCYIPILPLHCPYCSCVYCILRTRSVNFWGCAQPTLQTDAGYARELKASISGLNSLMRQKGVFSFVAFVSCLTLGNTYGMTSSEAPVVFCQPGFVGTKLVSVREGGDPPPIKGLDTTLGTSCVSPDRQHHSSGLTAGGGLRSLQLHMLTTYVPGILNWPSKHWLGEITWLLYRETWPLPICRDLLSQVHGEIFHPHPKRLDLRAQSVSGSIWGPWTSLWLKPSRMLGVTPFSIYLIEWWTNC